MTPALVLDLVVVVLLGVASAYGWALSRRLNRLSAAQAELKDALAAFDDATRRADETLRRIEAIGVARGAEIQAAAARAASLLNELSVMTSAGERIADRIEAAVKNVRALGAEPRERRRVA